MIHHCRRLRRRRVLSGTPSPASTATAALTGIAAVNAPMPGSSGVVPATPTEGAASLGLGGADGLVEELFVALEVELLLDPDEEAEGLLELEAVDQLPALIAFAAARACLRQLAGIAA